jgi:hypothetical protein
MVTLYQRIWLNMPHSNGNDHPFSNMPHFPQGNPHDALALWRATQPV